MKFFERFYTDFDARVREVVAYGYAHSPAFRARMIAADLTPEAILSRADLAKLPVLRKEHIPQIQRSGPRLGGMLTVELHQLRRIFQSPGPIYDPEPNEPDSWRWSSPFRAIGIGPGDIVLNCFGYHLVPAGLMFEEGARACHAAVIPAGIGGQAQQIAAFADLGVTVYAGLPSYLKALLEKAREQGHDPRQWSLKKALVAAEPLPPSLRTLFQDEYGIEVFNLYGTAETGCLGYEGPSHEGLHLPEDALVEVCDLNSGLPLPPGETGEVVVTLFRRDYILVRFAVGDLSALMREPSPDPIAAPRLVGWLGRSADSIKVRGIFVHPRHADEALAAISGVAAYQIAVTREDHRDELVCRFVAIEGANTAALAETIAAALQDALKLRCRAEPVAALPEGAARFVDERTWE